MRLTFKPNLPRTPWTDVSHTEWRDWRWQMRASLKNREDFARAFVLSQEECDGFCPGSNFQFRVTPYYASLTSAVDERDPIRRIFIPRGAELRAGSQQMEDPLGERKNTGSRRLIHRYPDRVLFLITDFCSVYCRFCTRKYFTGNDEALIAREDYDRALEYIRAHTGVREVILSGGDPLTLSDDQLERVLQDLRAIPHVEIIRVGSRMPVVNPFRMTERLAQVLRRYKPVYLMTHFSHPRELTAEAAVGLEIIADHGVPMMNQFVLLNGVNNDAAIVAALCRRLLYLRVKPYYMFQCDPSIGTDHLRTSVEESMRIQRELWGNLSGLAMPTLALDIPDGGGKVGLVPDFEIEREGRTRVYSGWDGVRAEYVSPPAISMITPADAVYYADEWSALKRAKAIEREHKFCDVEI